MSVVRSQQGAGNPITTDWRRKTYVVAWILHLSPAEEREMKKGLLILAASLMTLAPVSAPAAVRTFVTVGRPYYYGGFYRPFWGAYWGPGWGTTYFAYPN